MLRQILFRQNILIGHRNSMLNDIFELPYVSRVGVIHQLHQGAARNFFDLFVMRGGKLPQEVVCESGDIFLSGAQWRHDHLDDVQSIKQIFAKSSFFEFLAQFPVSGGNHSHVDLNRFAAADGGETLFLENSQEFALQLGRNLAYLIEEKRAAVCRFEAAGAVLDRAGERAFGVTEEFALVKLARDRRAIDADERLLAAAAARRMNIRLRPRVGEHVVAGSTLAWVWPVSEADQELSLTGIASVVDDAVRIGFERTGEQDPGLGLRQLCDIACKALSPAVNDPYTAIQASEHLSVLFAALAARPAGDLVVHDSERSVLVAVPARSFAEYLALFVGLIRRFGASEPTVIAAMLRLLAAAVGAMGAEPDRWAAVENEADLLVVAAQRSVVEPADLHLVHRERAALEDLLLTRRAAVRETSN